MFVNAASKKIRFQCRAPDFDKLFLRPSGVGRRGGGKLDGLAPELRAAVFFIAGVDVAAVAEDGLNVRRIKMTDRSFGTTFVMLASDDPTISHEPMVSHMATPRRRTIAFFSSTVFGVSSLRTAASVGQKAVLRVRVEKRRLP